LLYHVSASKPHLLVQSASTHLLCICIKLPHVCSQSIAFVSSSKPRLLVQSASTHFSCIFYSLFCTDGTTHIIVTIKPYTRYSTHSTNLNPTTLDQHVCLTSPMTSIRCDAGPASPQSKLRCSCFKRGGKGQG
jgi:hypothetical protein